MATAVERVPMQNKVHRRKRRKRRWGGVGGPASDCRNIGERQRS